MSVSRVANGAFADSANNAFAKLSAWLLAVPVSRWRSLVIILVSIWLVRTLAQVFWIVFPAPASPVAQVTPVVAAMSAESASTSINVAALQATHLFGFYDPAKAAEDLAKRQKEAEEKAAAAPIVDTRLNLKLQGVVDSSNPEKSLAIIGEQRNQKLYKVGDKIPGVSGTVKLAKVEGSRIVLNNNGKMEALWLYGKDGKKLGTANASAPSRAPVRTPSRPDVKSVVVDRNEVFKVKTIGDVVRFMVHTEGGEMVGYKVRPGRKRELFDQVGLKSNDIVLSVNGIEVNEPSKVREVYQALKTATEASLEVLREGSTELIEIRLSE